MTQRLFEADIEPIKGVVLVAHGLNNRPEAMDSLIRVLVLNGFHCLRISLHQDAPGNRATPEAIANDWISTFTDAYDEISQRFATYPVYNLSYSLGALITIRFLEVIPAATFERMVLLAPPVALTWRASLVRLLAPLARFGLVLPSAAPAEIRARWGTPVGEYVAMLKLVDAVRTLERSEKLARIKTRIFLDRDDELVSATGVLAWLDRNSLHSWSAKGLPNRAPEGRTYSHLMVSEKSLGHMAWAELIQDVLAHFNQRK